MKTKEEEFNEALARNMEPKKVKGVKERLVLARKEILETKIQKEGKNTFSKYTYFTPSQITALVTKACINNGILTVFNIFKRDEDYIGELTVHSTDSDEAVNFTIPTAMPDIKATNITQKLGGMVTYTQRYLEMVAFGITDNNLDLDSQDNRGDKVKPTLTAERFQKGVDKVASGDMTKDVFLKSLTAYELTNVQTKALLLL